MKIELDIGGELVYSKEIKREDAGAWFEALKMHLVRDTKKNWEIFLVIEGKDIDNQINKNKNETKLCRCNKGRNR